MPQKIPTHHEMQCSLSGCRHMHRCRYMPWESRARPLFKRYMPQDTTTHGTATILPRNGQGWLTGGLSGAAVRSPMGCGVWTLTTGDRTRTDDQCAELGCSEVRSGSIRPPVVKSYRCVKRLKVLFFFMGPYDDHICDAHAHATSQNHVVAE